MGHISNTLCFNLPFFLCMTDTIVKTALLTALTCVSLCVHPFQPVLLHTSHDDEGGQKRIISLSEAWETLRDDKYTKWKLANAKIKRGLKYMCPYGVWGIIRVTLLWGLFTEDNEIRVEECKCHSNIKYCDNIFLSTGPYPFMSLPWYCWD